MKTFHLYQDAMDAIQTGDIKTGDVIEANGGKYRVTESGSLLQAETYPEEQAPTSTGHLVDIAERTAGARQVGRITFFELADLNGMAPAADLMVRVIRMSSLLSYVDLANWVNAYERQEREAIAQRDAARRNND